MRKAVADPARVSGPKISDRVFIIKPWYGISSHEEAGIFIREGYTPTEIFYVHLST